jgi:hypothetical protein
VLRSRTLLVVLVALPGVVLGLAGLAHPVFLTPETAERWRSVHLVLLPVFPLLGGSVWLLLLGERGALAWGARGLAFAYAVLYTALDSIAGIGAGHQLQRSAARGDARPPVEDLFEVGDRLGHPGVVALALAVALTAALLLRRGAGPLAAVGAVVAVAGCWLLLRHHVFPPRGVAGVLLVAAGTGLMAAVAGRRVREGHGAARA